MFDLLLASALELQRPVAAEASDCRPRPHLLRGAPPPPAFSIERFESPRQERTSLSAFRCPDGINWRVDRHPSPAGRRDHVLGSDCPEMVRWVEAAARLPIPSPVLAAVPSAPPSATWYSLSGRGMAGSGYRSRMEVTLIDRPGGVPNPIAAWAREGEALFARCQSEQGGGGAMKRTALLASAGLAASSSLPAAPGNPPAQRTGHLFALRVDGGGNDDIDYFAYRGDRGSLVVQRSLGYPGVMGRAEVSDGQCSGLRAVVEGLERLPWPSIHLGEVSDGPYLEPGTFVSYRLYAVLGFTGATSWETRIDFFDVHGRPREPLAAWAHELVRTVDGCIARRG